jgi:hypothetical protein
MSDGDHSHSTVRPRLPDPGDATSGRWSAIVRSVMGKVIPPVLGLVVISLAYFWCFQRVVVGPDDVMVLIKKNGSKALPGDQIIVPTPPDREKDPAGYEKWEHQYGDCNGVLEQVMRPGTYFQFSPFDYERQIIKLADTNAAIPPDKVGVVVRKFKDKLNDRLEGPRNPMPKVLTPAVYYEYANPFAYEVKWVDPGTAAVTAGFSEQHAATSEDFERANPFEKRILPMKIQSRPFEMAVNDGIHFRSGEPFGVKWVAFVPAAIVALLWAWTLLGNPSNWLGIGRQHIIIDGCLDRRGVELNLRRFTRPLINYDPEAFLVRWKSYHWFARDTAVMRLRCYGFHFIRKVSNNVPASTWSVRIPNWFLLVICCGLPFFRHFARR